MDAQAAFFLGVLGGLLAQLGRMSTLRVTSAKGLPKYIRHWWYWAQAVCWVLAGGLLACAYTMDGARLTALVCLNVGLTAPLIVQTLARSAPAGRPGSVS
jgi:hypothetical protein